MKMLWKLLFAAIFFAKNVIAANETENDLTFVVAVVEYKPISNYTSQQDKVTINSLEYISLLNSTNQDLELILFPEATLGGGISDATVVPLPFSETICNSSDSTYKDYLKRFSCAAIEYNTTIVVNLKEKENCTSKNATGFCPDSGIIYYNSNVAFNNDGQVIGRYRKWNLFGEYNLSPPAEVELVSITTKNNNTFGMFTCFDIMFAQPALNLTRDLGLTNILFPTMWFSELPYLTALQTQQMWAYETDVNFMSSGANNPAVGSGGTGIFVGKDGPLDQEIIGDAGGIAILIQRVPRLDVANNPYRNVTAMQEDTDALALELDNFVLITDPSITNYTSVLLDTNRTVINEVVCGGEDVVTCCEFNVTISINPNISSGNQYKYHLTVFNGVRSFSGVRNGGFESCGILACLNESLNSCGKRFSNYSEVTWPLTFENITISGNFTNDENRIQFPNSVLTSLRSISPQHTVWAREDSNATVKRTFSLTKPQDRILTFGILGRDFSRDGGLIQPDDDDNGGETLKRFSPSLLAGVLLFVVAVNRVV